ncbi:primase-helicase family protein [Roseovarius sp. 2305UL8-3]|uniref:primase-helicase family protein n=1 Tax=Roseovarius conchicola TaxID=3121636 RepID=UPI003528F4F6
MLARGAFDVFDDLRARALRCLSHRPLLSGYDEPETLPYQIPLFGPIGADVRQFDPFNGSQISWRMPQFCQAKSYDDMFCGWDIDKNVPIIKPAAGEWCKSDKARRYVKQEMRYDTLNRTISTDTGSILNTFRGWATMPVMGEWPAISYLIREVICASNEQAAEYLLNYLAHMIQKPMQLPGTAIILQSEEQGTGKSTFMDLIRELLGERYCATTADASTLVGQFNNSAKEKILLHFEEAVAPNDRAVESKVKALITNKTMTYNAKGIAAVEARNCARVFMTSNASQVAHIARHDRRMFVLVVSPRHANDWGYWDQFRRQYPHEMEAFMHVLQTSDISGFKPGAIPHTQGRDDQKLESAVGPERVLRDLLESGVLPPCSRNVGGAWEVRTKALAEHFRNFNIRVGSNAPQPARVLKSITLVPGRNRTMTVSGDTAQTHRVITIPALQAARAAFLQHMNVAAHDWGDADDADWSLE